MTNVCPALLQDQRMGNAWKNGSCWAVIRGTGCVELGVEGDRVRLDGGDPESARGADDINDF